MQKKNVYILLIFIITVFIINVYFSNITWEVWVPHPRNSSETKKKFQPSGKGGLEK